MSATDVPSVVDVHLRSFSGFFLSSLGPAFLKAYYASARDEMDSVALVALEGDDVVGFVLGSAHPAGFYKRLLQRHWLRFAVASLPRVIRSPSSTLRVLRAVRYPSKQPAAAGIAVLFSIAVLPDTQGRGAGALLIEAFLAELSRQGAIEVRLETDAAENDMVRAFYESHDFRMMRTFETAEGRRMVEYERVLVDGGIDDAH